MSGICTVVAGSACRAIVQCLPHAVVLLDERFRIVLANRAASVVFRTPAESLRGQTITELLPHPNLGAFLSEFGDRRMKVMETVLPSARGSLTVSVTAVRVSYWNTSRRTAASKRELRLLVLQDITEKTLLEQQLIETEKRAAIGQLAAGILHELSNPMASMRSNLLFVRGALSAPIESDVRQALDSSLDQLEELRQLLGTLSIVPRRQPRYELADLHDVIRRCTGFLAREAQRRRIEIALACEPASLQCEMDSRLMKQVLLNLFKNSMEAMPNGGEITVRTALRPPQREEPAAVVIEVEDTGSGISDHDLRRVFRPLFSTKPGGTGLGLSFCRQVVEEHGGWIRLSRGRSRGTVATLLLPLQQMPAVGA